MNTKLTLSINKNISEKAKKYARLKKTSLSKLVERHLVGLTSTEEPEEISPLVKSLSGIVSERAAKKGVKRYSTFRKNK